MIYEKALDIMLNIKIQIKLVTVWFKKLHIYTEKATGREHIKCQKWVSLGGKIVNNLFSKPSTWPLLLYSKENYYNHK